MKKSTLLRMAQVAIAESDLLKADVKVDIIKLLAEKESIEAYSESLKEGTESEATE